MVDRESRSGNIVATSADTIGAVVTAMIGVEDF